MQIVTDIPNSLYANLKKIKGDSVAGKRIIDCVINGTPLPKGHGDLIDRGELKTHFIGTEQGTDLEVYLEPTIINAPPIIPADKEE